MIPQASWKKSSFSGGGEGNDCVEIADLDTHIAVRDSKDPARTPLTFPATAFAPFLQALKGAGTSGPGTHHAS
ncbi:DUF397 domain-containing protein [Streptomyces sp. SP2-10]|uniref:DUF397 domain-containing protein n=1 Tax=Streptomyces sp. SP2-10 TaxID=2873385 RepID=UPI001CA601F9|nr:DUF397 domain-containing protein [Streptomyces sp. SP2-10]MBY8844995.1 DUF397 domain-containing protein [Streptomyces sp. SP2-10]